MTSEIDWSKAEGKEQPQKEEPSLPEILSELKEEEDRKDEEEESENHAR